MSSLVPKKEGDSLTKLLSASGGYILCWDINNHYWNINRSLLWLIIFNVCIEDTKFQERFYKNLPFASWHRYTQLIVLLVLVGHFLFSEYLCYRLL